MAQFCNGLAVISWAAAQVAGICCLEVWQRPPSRPFKLIRWLWQREATGLEDRLILYRTFSNSLREWTACTVFTKFSCCLKPNRARQWDVRVPKAATWSPWYGIAAEQTVVHDRKSSTMKFFQIWTCSHVNVWLTWMTWKILNNWICLHYL